MICNSREAKAARAEQIAKGELTADRNVLLVVKLPMTEPVAFELLLSYIYTDRIDCECPKRLMY